MTKRTEVITSLIVKCETLADVGCDHGYVSFEALKSGKSEKVYLTDISPKSLDKAVRLLSEFFPSKFTPYLTDGLTDVPYIDEAVIAGMGGEEIIKILKKSVYKPVILILQPMKNVDKVRKYLHESGYGIERDFMFYAEDKYYEVLRAKLNYEDDYTETEELYGRENLKNNADFLVYLDRKIKETEQILCKNLKEQSRNAIKDRLETLKGLKDEIKRDIRID